MHWAAVEAIGTVGLLFTALATFILPLVSRRPLANEAAIRRAIKAALAAGLKPGQFEVRADCESVSVVTLAETRFQPEVDTGDSLEAWRARCEIENERRAHAATDFRHRAATLADRGIIARAFQGKQSLPEVAVAKLLGLTLNEFSTITAVGLLTRAYRGGPARYTQEAVLGFLTGETCDRRAQNTARSGQPGPFRSKAVAPMSDETRAILRLIRKRLNADRVEAIYRDKTVLTEEEMAQVAGVTADDIKAALTGMPGVKVKATAAMEYDRFAALLLVNYPL